MLDNLSKYKYDRLLIVIPLKILIPKWNEKIWIEDYSVKIRRQKILNLNFKDFTGLPTDKNLRKCENQNYIFKLPVPRPKNSSRDLHPLSVKK